MDFDLSESTLYLTSPQTFPVSVTAPLYDTVFTAGGLAMVTWTEPRSPTISQITLTQSIKDQPQSIIQVAISINSEDEKFAWRIPADFPTGSNYAFELGTAPNATYTGFFTIKSINDRSTFLNTSFGAHAAESLAQATFQIPITAFKLIAVGASIAAGTAFLLI
jgi:hypothetical protein